MTDNWNIKDLPIGDFKVTTEPNPITGEITQITEVAGRIEAQVIRTKANQTRNALIDLGWIPPATWEPQRPILEPGLLAEASELSEHIKLQGTPLAELTRADLMVLAVEYCRGQINQENHDG